MDITHLGQQLILYFDVFVKFVLCIFRCLFHTLESILFHEFIYFILPGPNFMN